MDESMDALQAAFDSCAGAGYSVAGALLLETDGNVDNRPDRSVLFYWLMMTEAIARSDGAVTVLPWLRDQIQMLGAKYSSIENGLKKEFAARWTAWLPLLFFMPVSEHQMVWKQFHEEYPSDTPEQDAIRTVLFQYVSRYGRSLFLPGDWQGEVKNPERYTSPDACAMVKLGLTLVSLAEESEKERCELFREWTDLLKSAVLRRLPERVQAGFAPEWPQFQELVLAILNAAEWLLQPDPWRVAEFIRDNRKRADERMTEDQLALAGALFGWIKGYHSVAAWIDLEGLRQALSEQGMCLALQHVQGQGQIIRDTDPVIFYATPGGDRYSFGKPYAMPGQIEHREQRIITEQEKIIPIRDTLEVQLAGGVFRFRINLEH